jgi:hypothetical protein
MKSVCHDEKESQRILEKIGYIDKSMLSQSRVGDLGDEQDE